MTCHCRDRYEHADRAVSYDRSQRSEEVKELQGRVLELTRELERKQLDLTNFEVEETLQQGRYFALKLRYVHSEGVLAASDCTFEGVKVLVFEGVTIVDAIRWTRIDPHFREVAPTDPHSAPSPIARFTGDAEGWKNAARFIDALCAREGE